jgi:hypothetical protein
MLNFMNFLVAASAWRALEEDSSSNVGCWSSMLMTLASRAIATDDSRCALRPSLRADGWMPERRWS